MPGRHRPHANARLRTANEASDCHGTIQRDDNLGGCRVKALKVRARVGNGTNHTDPIKIPIDQIGRVFRFWVRCWFQDWCQSTPVPWRGSTCSARGALREDERC